MAPDDSDEQPDTTVIQRMVYRVIDAALSTASDAFLVVPGAIGVIGVVAFAFRYHTFGVVLVIVAVVVVVLINMLFSGLKHVAIAWVDDIVGPSNEARPLLD